MSDWVLLLILTIAVAVLVLGLVGAFTVVRWVWRYLTGALDRPSPSPAPGPAEPSRLAAAEAASLRCPVCQRTLAQGRCLACGWQRRTAPADRAAEITRATLEQLHAQGRISDAVLSEVLTALSLGAQSSLAPSEKPAVAPIPNTLPVGESVTSSSAAAASLSRDEILDADLVLDAQLVPDADGTAAASSGQSPLDVRRAARERTARYLDARARRDATEPLVPPAPQRSWTDVFAAFLEARNIRWGEIIGGLLIVSCSIALVVSFWTEIASRPWLKFGVFGAITSSLLALAMYVERYWKLPHTSRTLYAIGLLLVPLNFVSMSGAAGSGATLVSGAVIGQLLSFGLFGALIGWVSRSIFPNAWVRFTLAALVPCLLQVVISRWVPAASGHNAALGAAVALLASHVLAILIPWWSARHDTSQRSVVEHYTIWAISLYGTAVMLIWTAMRSGEAVQLARHISGFAPWMALPVMVSGWWAWPVESSRSSKNLRMLIAVATALAGALVSVGFVLAWPVPQNLTLILVNAALGILAAALVLRSIAVAAPAIPLLNLGFLLAWHVWHDRLAWLDDSSQRTVDALLRPENGLLSLPFFAASLGAVLLASRRSDRTAARSWTVAAQSIAAPSLLVSAIFGLGSTTQPWTAAIVLSFYSVVLTVIGLAAPRRNPAWTWLGSALSGVALWQVLAFAMPEDLRPGLPDVSALLAHATVWSTLGLAARHFRWRTSPLDTSSRRETDSGSPAVAQADAGWFGVGVSPLDGSAIVSLCGALVMSVAIAGASIWHWSVETNVTAYLAWGNAIALLIAWTRRSIVGRELALTLTYLVVAIGIHEHWRGASWYVDDAFAMHQVALLGVGWAVLSLACAALGRVSGVFTDRTVDTTDGRSLITTLPDSGVLSFGLMASVLAFAMVAGYRAVPGIGQEFELLNEFSFARSIEDFQFLGLHHRATQLSMCWGWLAILAVAVGLTREPSELGRTGAITLLLVGASCLVASVWEPDRAVGSALRWVTAALLFVGALGIAAIRWSQAIGRSRAEQVPRVSLSTAFWSLLTTVAVAHFGILAVMPPRVLPYGVVQVLAGPIDSSWFVRIGDTANYAVPLAAVAIAIALGGAALRLPMLYFVGGCVAQALVTVVAVQADASLLTSIDHWPRALLWNLIASSVITCLWLWASEAGRAWLRRTWNESATSGDHAEASEAERAERFDLPLQLQCMLHIGLLGIATVVFGFIAWMEPTFRPRPVVLWTGLTAVVGASAVLIMNRRFVQDQQRALSAIGRNSSWELLRRQASRFEQSLEPPTYLTLLSDWSLWIGPLAVALAGLAVGLSYGVIEVLTTLSVGWLLLAAGIVLGRARSTFVPIGHQVGVCALAMFNVINALRIGFDQQQLPLCAGLLAGSAAVWWLLAYRTMGAGALVTGSIALQLATFALSIEWLDARRVHWTVYPLAQAITLALTTVLWSAFDRSVLAVRRESDEALKWHWSKALPNWYAGPLRLAVVVIGVCSWMRLSERWAVGQWASPDSLAPFVAVLVTVAGTLVVWRRRWTQTEMFGLYVLALAIVVEFTCTPSLDWTWASIALFVGIALVNLLASYAAHRMDAMQPLLRRAGFPAYPPMEELHGGVFVSLLVVVNAVLWAGSLALMYAVVDVELRTAVARSTLAMAVSCGMLSGFRSWGRLRQACLMGLVYWAVTLAWAPLNLLRTDVVTWLTATSIATLIASGVLTVAYRWKSLMSESWGNALRSTVGWSNYFGIAFVTITLGAELIRAMRGYPIDVPRPMAATLAGILALWCGLLILAAVQLRPNPWQLSPQRRGVYVYAAEFVAAMIAIHLRLTIPELFGDWFTQFWPLIVLGFALLGALVGELLMRTRHGEVGVALSRSGLFLPLLPLVGYAFVPSSIDVGWTSLGAFVLYATLAMHRRSPAITGLAALAANFAIWRGLAHIDTFELARHPQLWLIPPAVSVLVIIQLFDRRLSKTQVAAARYVCLMMIYLSSTGDIFINGMRQAPWLPLMLAALSVLGMLAGMWLRARSFLYTGITFLVFSLACMLWHAAVDLQQTWIWYASGIVLGIAILLLFAMFERQRERLRGWTKALDGWEL